MLPIAKMFVGYATLLLIIQCGKCLSRRYIEPVQPQSLWQQRSNFSPLCLLAHNKFRKQHGAAQMTLDKNLIQYAETRLKAIMNSNDLAALPDSLYGENVYMGIGTTSMRRRAVAQWYKEESLYSTDKPYYRPETGHFTQLIWANSTRLGCAAIRLPSRRFTYVVAEYDPPGNIDNKFKENVKYTTQQLKLKRRKWQFKKTVFQ